MTTDTAHWTKIIINVMVQSASGTFVLMMREGTPRSLTKIAEQYWSRVMSKVIVLIGRRQ